MATAQYTPALAPTASTYTWVQLYPLVVSGKLTNDEALAVVNGTANAALQAKADQLVGTDPSVGPDAKAVHAKRVEDGTGQAPNPSGGGASGSGSGSGTGTGTPGDSGSGIDPGASAPGGQGGGGTPITPGYFNAAGDWVTGAAGGSGVTTAILRYLAPTAGNIVNGILQSNATTAASEAQQKYLQEALDYEKSRDAAAIALEGSRYSDYTGNIAPYLATGNSANARMASLLGLPAAPSLGGGPVGTGPGGITTQPSATSTAAGGAIGAPTASVTTGAPLPRATPVTATSTGVPGATPPYLPPGQTGTVQMRAPNGEVGPVNQADVQHYLSLGAVLV